MKRKQVRMSNVHVELQGSLQEIRDEVNNLIDKYGLDAEIEIDSYGEEFSIDLTRPETDEEMAIRLKEEKRTEANRISFFEQQERQQYEQLKKKFEK